MNACIYKEAVLRKLDCQIYDLQRSLKKKLRLKEILLNCFDQHPHYSDHRLVHASTFNSIISLHHQAAMSGGGIRDVQISKVSKFQGHGQITSGPSRIQRSLSLSLSVQKNSRSSSITCPPENTNVQINIDVIIQIVIQNGIFIEYCYKLYVMIIEQRISEHKIIECLNTCPRTGLCPQLSIIHRCIIIIRRVMCCCCPGILRVRGGQDIFGSIEGSSGDDRAVDLEIAHSDENDEFIDNDNENDFGDNDNGYDEYNNIAVTSERAVDNYGLGDAIYSGGFDIYDAVIFFFKKHEPLISCFCQFAPRIAENARVAVEFHSYIRIFIQTYIRIVLCCDVTIEIVSTTSFTSICRILNKNFDLIRDIVMMKDIILHSSYDRIRIRQSIKAVIRKYSRGFLDRLDDLWCGCCESFGSKIFKILQSAGCLQRWIHKNYWIIKNLYYLHRACKQHTRIEIIKYVRIISVKYIEVLVFTNIEIESAGPIRDECDDGRGGLIEKRTKLQIGITSEKLKQICGGEYSRRTINIQIEIWEIWKICVRRTCDFLRDILKCGSLIIARKSITKIKDVLDTTIGRFRAHLTILIQIINCFCSRKIEINIEIFIEICIRLCCEHRELILVIITSIELCLKYDRSPLELVRRVLGVLK